MLVQTRVLFSQWRLWARHMVCFPSSLYHSEEWAEGPDWGWGVAGRLGHNSQVVTAWSSSQCRGWGAAVFWVVLKAELTDLNKVREKAPSEMAGCRARGQAEWWQFTRSRVTCVFSPGGWPHECLLCGHCTEEGALLAPLHLLSFILVPAAAVTCP